MKELSYQEILRVHRRQFVIGQREFLVRSDWRTFELQPNLILSVDPDLRVGRTKDLDGTSWFIFGLAVDTRPEFATPLEEIARRRTEDVPSLYEGWAGRWALVGAGCLHLDGAAMLGCYYGQNYEGELWASSSPVLIQQALNIPDEMVTDTHDGSKWRPSKDATVTGAVRGISWYPPPHSSIPGVFRLLPTQILDLQRGKCQSRSLASNLEGNYNDTELFEAIQISLSTAIKHFAELNAPNDLTLLLSGGRDSRLLLSIAAATGVPVKTYTRIHRRASLADRVLPPQLARIAGYPYTKHYQRQEIAGRSQAILDHAGYNVSWLSAEEFLRGGSDPLKGIALAGFCAALGRDRLIPMTSAQEATGKKIAAHFCEGNSPDLTAAFDAWIALRREDPDSCLDLCDYFFLEQRTAGRKGIKEQIFDLFPVERVAPLNSARIFALICNLSPEAKLKALWIPEIIKSTKPELLRYPMNPPDKYFGLLHNTLLKNPLYKRKIGIGS
ncbi:MAG: hypothetical protein RIG63_21090 [Coleofasciculus chthonoplastes F3-SA18-01]|uniref:hypothetical protein n=1 Tax=Coleofasciculus chthonoplastes TaxID=64178 RepID=UPI0032F3B418